LREITFRDAGGGTGKSVDIDEFDLDVNPFHQLIVWNPEYKEIVGGYRFLHGRDIPCDRVGCLNSATSELFKFSDKFIRDYLPLSIELGRSFVQPEYQPTVNFRKGMYSLDNLWDGLGAIIVENTDIKYFFGKMTMYPSYNRVARDIVLSFLKKYFPDHENLLTPYESVHQEADQAFLNNSFQGKLTRRIIKILVHEVRSRNETFLPLSMPI